mmetsp:Transcript_14612/g.39102  ORF Transcript_14612/g.39102 Transcript_14612/m.39102 type:complete len:104 (+) Transcript_14612:268-579(+)
MSSAHEWDVWSVVLGATVVAGGVLGFAKARSAPSLVAGGALGGALVYAGVVAWGDAALAASAAVTLAMGARFARTRKVAPAGIVTLLAAANSLRLLNARPHTA